MIRKIVLFIWLLMMLVPVALSETVLTVLNVGKADCLLLQYDGATWMIDTGSEERWPDIEEAMQYMHIISLDGVILTHADKDHIGGLRKLVASDVEVGAWYTSAWSDKYVWDSNPIVMHTRGTVKGLSVGDTLSMGDASICVLWPEQEMDSENDNSLVLLVETPDGMLLLMGDATKKVEKALVKNDSLPKCDVLKVGHHGKDDATSKAFLKVCQPEIAVISTDVEENENTADEDVLKRLRKQDIQVAITQDYGLGVQVILQEGTAVLRPLEYGY